MADTATYIELPRDKSGFLSYSQDEPCIIRAEEASGTMLRVLEPASFAETWPTVEGGSWMEVAAEPGLISNTRWATLILDTPGLSQWVYDAAYRRKGIATVNEATADLIPGNRRSY